MSRGAFIIIVTFAVASATSADTITVCDSGCDYTSISAAIAAAADGDVIQLSAQTYAEGETILTGDRDVAIVGTIDALGNPTSIIDGQSTHGVVECDPASPATVTLRNLVIQNGDQAAGGALYMTGTANVVIRNCWFLENRALTSLGGAIVNYEGSLDITECRFAGNRAENGGAIEQWTGTTAVRDSVFTSNFAISGGGAIAAGGTFTVENCLFLGNTAERGGAILGADGLTVRKCVFDSNIAVADGGGAVANLNDADPTFIECTFTDNSGALGGAVGNYFDSSPTIRDCIFESNSATDKGTAIYNLVNASPVIEGCTFRRNEVGGPCAGLGAAAISSGDPTSVPEIRDTLFCENECGDISGAYTGTGNTFSESCGCPDADADGVCDDDDQCPGIPDVDGDGDGVADCVDECPADPLKTELGRCGCGSVDTPVKGDFNCDGVFDSDDYIAMQAALGICAGDLDGNGRVDGADFGLLFVGWGNCP